MPRIPQRVAKVAIKRTQMPIQRVITHLHLYECLLIDSETPLAHSIRISVLAHLRAWKVG